MALINITAHGHAQVRVNLASAHLRGALVQARDCAPLERDNEWPATQEILDRHFSLAAGAIILSICSLEAAINEFRQDAIDGFESHLGRAWIARKQIVDLWDTVDRQPLLRKYEWILTLANVEPLTRGTQPLQSVADLIELRDALVHYKPEWYHDLKQSKALEKRLAKKFPLNKLAGEGMAFVPYACGHGSGLWAVRSALSFLLAFYDRLAIDSKKLDHIKILAAKAEGPR